MEPELKATFTETSDPNCLPPSKTAASPLSEIDQMVDGKRLLMILFPDGNSRPSIKWLRQQVQRRQIPYIKKGRKVWYTPRSVKEWFALKEIKPLRMK